MEGETLEKQEEEKKLSVIKRNTQGQKRGTLGIQFRPVWGLGFWTSRVRCNRGLLSARNNTVATLLKLPKRGWDNDSG